MTYVAQPRTVLPRTPSLATVNGNNPNGHEADVAPQAQRRDLADVDKLPPAYFDFRSPSEISNGESTPNSPPQTPLQRERSTPIAHREATERARRFISSNPLSLPCTLNLTERVALSMGYAGLTRPEEFGRNKVFFSRTGTSAIRTSISTKKGCIDACLTSSTPLFSARHSPAHDWTMLAYFEVRLMSLDTIADSGVVIGFVAHPYPTWRMPGYERASLGVHSGNGRRYVNDSKGREFVDPLRTGDIAGIGMRFRPSASEERARLPAYGESHAVSTNADTGQDLDVEVFFTRNGRFEDSWDLHELVDAEFEQPGRLTGLEGHHDLYAAVGVFGKVDLDARFGRNNWAYNPVQLDQDP